MQQRRPLRVLTSTDQSRLLEQPRGRVAASATPGVVTVAAVLCTKNARARSPCACCAGPGMRHGNLARTRRRHLRRSARTATAATEPAPGKAGAAGEAPPVQASAASSDPPPSISTKKGLKEVVQRLGLSEGQHHSSTCGQHVGCFDSGRGLVEAMDTQVQVVARRATKCNT